MTTEQNQPDPVAGVRVRLASDAAALDRELAEIDLLVAQAKTEAARHEQRRAQSLEKGTDPDQILTLTRRAALMDAQVEVLEGKRKVLSRYRDAVRTYDEALAGVSPGDAPAPRAGETVDADAPIAPAMSRVILTAQEDLRREIARAMHDGPAQSLTNIVLQTQILERMLARDPVAAQKEARLLVGMVQQTLEATKTFIFDVRPMVLDDLGIVPTLRRAARERGRRASIPVDFDSVGADRRLPMEVESAVFRILDEALGGLLAGAPERVRLRLDWSDRLDARLTASRHVELPPADDLGPREEPKARKGKGAPDELPPALAEMMAARQADRAAAIAAAEDAAVVRLPATVRREILARAASVAADLTIDEQTGEIRLVVPLDPRDEPGGTPEAA